MSGEFDAFSVRLLDEAKRFLEKATLPDNDPAFLHAALVLAFSAFESHINGVADELQLRSGNSILDKSMLTERELKFEKGGWELGKARFYRLEDRVLFIFRRYGDQDASDAKWWSDLKEAMDARNKLVHPRDAIVLSPADCQRYLAAIVEALNAVYLAVFGRGHPSYGRGLQSTSTF